jgi:hypothetical protein
VRRGKVAGDGMLATGTFPMKWAPTLGIGFPPMHCGTSAGIELHRFEQTIYSIIVGTLSSLHRAQLRAVPILLVNTLVKVIGYLAPERQDAKVLRRLVAARGSESTKNPN